MKTTMGIILGLCLLATTAAAQDTDRTLAVKQGMRLEISNHAGEVIVQGWDRDEVHLVADHDGDGEIQVDQGEHVLRLRARSRHGGPTEADYRIQAPRWMDVEIQGPYCEMRIEGMESQLYLETVEGGIQVDGGRGHVDLRSVEGDLSVRNAQGSLEVSSVEGGIHLEEVQGPVRCETIDGDLVLRRIDSDDVEASTVDGEILFEGRLRKEGQYRLMTHDGDITVGIPEDTDATLTVSQMDGDFESCFPLQGIQRDRGRRFETILGDGSARLEIQAFSGDITVCRPGGE